MARELSCGDCSTTAARLWHLVGTSNPDSNYLSQQIFRLNLVGSNLSAQACRSDQSVRLNLPAQTSVVGLHKIFRLNIFGSRLSAPASLSAQAFRLKLFGSSFRFKHPLIKLVWLQPFFRLKPFGSSFRGKHPSMEVACVFGRAVVV